MNTDLFWIPGPWRGRLAIAPRPRGWDWLGDEAAAWRRAGVDVVVSLLEKSESAELGLDGERRAAENEAIRFVSFPFPDRGVPASLEAGMSAVAVIVAELNAGKSVAVHCRQSIGRSGLVASAVLKSSGVPADEAMQTVGAARGIPVPETPEQRRWIERFPSALPAAKEL